MPRYQIEHITRYHYSQSVGLSLQLAHLCPRDTDTQVTLSHALTVSPTPEDIRETRDYFGNPVSRFELATAHRVLTITARSEVDVNRSIELPENSPPWQDASANLARTLWGLTDEADAAEFLFPSSMVPHSPMTREYALQSFGADVTLIEGATDLMHRIHADFEFDPDATHVATPVETVLDIRRGVCQDFAHLMISCLRSIGLPARYVSGYLLTQPPPGQPRLIGADASHAWVALHVPDYGWLDLDPTNDVIPGNHHVTLGWGRDFADVSPLRGVIQGGGEHSVTVEVTMTPVEEAKAMKAETPAAIGEAEKGEEAD